MSDGDHHKAGILRHLPMKKDTWLRGISADEMADIRTQATTASRQLSLASWVASAGLTILASAYFAFVQGATVAPWVWVAGGIGLGVGFLWFITSLKAGTRVGEILDRVEQRHKTEEEMGKLPPPLERHALEEQGEE